MTLDELSIMVSAMITDVRDIIAQWPNREAFAEAVGCSKEQAHKWAQNNAIPAWYQERVLRACEVSRVPLTAERMLSIHADKRTRRGSETAA